MRRFYTEKPPEGGSLGFRAMIALRRPFRQPLRSQGRPWSTGDRGEPGDSWHPWHGWPHASCQRHWRHREWSSARRSSRRCDGWRRHGQPQRWTCRPQPKWDAGAGGCWQHAVARGQSADHQCGPAARRPHAGAGGWACARVRPWRRPVRSIGAAFRTWSRGMPVARWCGSFRAWLRRGDATRRCAWTRRSQPRLGAGAVRGSAGCSDCLRPSWADRHRHPRSRRIPVRRSRTWEGCPSRPCQLAAGSRTGCFGTCGSPVESPVLTSLRTHHASDKSIYTKILYIIFLCSQINFVAVFRISEIMTVLFLEIMKTSFILYSLLLISMPLTSFAQTITGENFVLTGPDGKMTAQLATGGEGTPGLFFYDTRWVPRITIGLYGDQVPGIVLNDEKGLATALLRMVNNQWDPVLVLKENGQDHLIIDKNGIRNTPGSSPIGTMNIIFISLISGWFGGFLVFLMMQKKDDKIQNPFLR